MLEKYEKEASKYWDKFYKRNTTNFFKDRHWIDREFEELKAKRSNSSDPTSSDNPSQQPLSSSDSSVCGNSNFIRALEVGCGVGNTVFPLLEANPDLFFYALDFAPHAIQLLKEHKFYISSGRCSGHVVDITKDELPTEIEESSLDIIMMIFVLSAISPQHFDNVIAKLAKVTKTGGKIMFRDYAVGDLAQQRFDGKEQRPQKIEENFYVRSDGTRAYYFAEQELIDLMKKNGFEVEDCKVVEKIIENRKKGSEMRRLWLQGKFIRTK